MKSPHPRTKAVKAAVSLKHFNHKGQMFHGPAAIQAGDTHHYCAVLPCASAKAAKLLCKVANMEPKARINWLLETMMEKHDLFIPFDDLRLIIASLGFEPTPYKAEGKAP